jgi:hypothetical protein
MALVKTFIHDTFILAGNGLSEIWYGKQTSDLIGPNLVFEFITSRYLL